MTRAGGKVDGDSWVTRTDRLRVGDRVQVLDDVVLVVGPPTSDGRRDGRVTLYIRVEEFGELGPEAEVRWKRDKECRLVSRDPREEGTSTKPEKIVRGPQVKMPW